MKKVFALLLTLLMVLCTTACNSQTSTDESNEPNKQVETTAPVTNDETTPSQGESDHDGDDQNSESDNFPSVTIEETVIYDENDIKITAVTVFETENDFSLFMKMENHSDKKASFYLNHCLLNGFQVMGYYGDLQADAGGEDSNSFVFNKSDIEFSGQQYWGNDKIATITGANAQLTVDGEKIPVPFTITTSAYTGSEVTFDGSGDKVYAKDGVTVIYKEMIETEAGDALTLLIKNETGKDFIIDVIDTFVNDKECGLSMWNYVFKDGIVCSHIILDPSMLEACGIDTVENVRFALCLTDTETYRPIAKSDEIEINLG